jgi:tripartite-type tricarboxylate transporter receptor subunit TctC
MDSWFRRAPAGVRNKLYGGLVEVLKAPQIIVRLRDFGAEPGGEPPERFAAFIHSETEKWTKLANEAGISAE